MSNVKDDLQKSIKTRHLRRELKTIRQLLSIGSIVGTSIITYRISSSLIIGTGVLVSHELGHYFSAKWLHANPDFPYIIPLGPIIIGITPVKSSCEVCHPIISSAGPVAGIMTGLIGAIITSSIGWFIGTMIALGTMTMEILTWFIGSDGKVLREGTRTQHTESVIF